VLWVYLSSHILCSRYFFLANLCFGSRLQVQSITRTNFQNLKEVFFITSSCTKTSLIFLIAIMVREMQMHLWRHVFQKFLILATFLHRIFWLKKDEYLETWRGLVHNIPKYKILSHYSHRCQGFGDTLSSCLAYFSDCLISCLSHLF